MWKVTVEIFLQMWEAAQLCSEAEKFTNNLHSTYSDFNYANHNDKFGYPHVHMINVNQPEWGIP